MNIEYTRVNWVDLPATDTPLSSENLNTMDAGIAQVTELANTNDDAINDIGLPLTDEEIDEICV